MAKEPNDNRDEDLESEDDERDTTEGEDEDTSSEADDESEDDEEEDDSDDEDDSEEESDEDDEEDEDEGDDDDDEGDKGKKKKPDPLAKFKGKSAEEIIEMYRNLESRVGSEALKKAQEILKQAGYKGKKPGKKDADDAADELDLFEGMSDEEISKLKPRDFAKLMSKKIMEQATKIARDTIEKTNEVRGNVSREIKAATQAHPHLKENAEYREVVISLIEAAAGRGEVLTLREACKKADKAMGIKAKKKEDRADDGDDDGEDRPPKKKKKPGMERGEGGDRAKQDTEEDRIKKGMLSAGQQGGTLGGLY